MTIQIIRDMGRNVPKDCQDPESEEYYHWLADVFEEVLNKRKDLVGNNHQMAIAREEKILIINAVREEGIWQVK